VEDSELRRSRRLLGLPPVILEPPPPPLRRKLDHQGSFEATGAFDPEQPPEESTANLGLVETSNTDIWTPVIVPVRFTEFLPGPHTAMATNATTSSGNSSVPITVVTTGDASPNLPSSSVRASMVSAATTSHSGPTPSIAAATPPYTPSATGAPFSYGMPSSGTCPALTSSISQTLGLGAGSSNAPLQGQPGGIPVSFNAFPYAGGHIPPSSPSLGGPHQQTAGQPAHTSSLGAGSQGQPAQTQPVGSSPFVWNGMLGNNTFASAAFPAGGTPIFGQSTLAQGTIPALGAHIPGPWNSAQGSVPSSGMPFWGNSFHSQWNPGQASMPLPTGPAWGNPSQSPSNTMNTPHPMSFMGNQQMMSPQMQNPYAGQGHGFYQNPGQQPNFSWQPGASQTPGPFYPGYQQQPKLPFLATLHLPDLTRLLNDPICHDPRWPPMPTKLPSDIPKFEAKPNEDPGDHVTTFHLWCSSNSLKDDSVQLRLFQRTLIGSAAKWYIELDRSRYSFFGELAMAFLNHFQLPVRYDAGTELLANFEQTSADHISDHIREWRRRKSLIKVPVPPAFLLEWFLKSLVPQLSKDVATSGVFSEEEAIMRAQQFELIYSQSGLLYTILPDAPRSILDKTRQRVGPHADGIVGSAQTKPAEQLTKQLQQLSIQHSAASQATALAAPPTQTSEVHSVQTTNPPAHQQPEGKKKQRKKSKGDKKPNDKAGEGTTEKKKARYPCNLCAEDHPTHLCPRLAEAQKFVTQQQQAVLTNPFQHKQNLTQASASTEGGSHENCPPPTGSSSANVYMMKSDAFIATRAHDYSKPSASEKGKEAEIPSLPLQIEKTLGETMTRIPKGAFKRASHNPNARAAQNYSVVEDLSQTPCAMSALEVLQSCPAQRKALLTALGSTETCNPGTIMLDTTDLKPRLPYHVAFQIVVAHPTKTFTRNIFRTVVDEGASTCVMSLACWKAIGQPELSPSPTLLTAFDGRSFRPHGIIPSFPVQLGGKTVCVEVEVVDAPIDYNLLLGRSWTYAMQAVVATVFRVLLFPHEGRIVTIDQLSFSRPDPALGASTVPMVDNPQAGVINIGVGLCPSLMGTFDYPPPQGDVKFISTHHKAEIFHVSSFRTTYFQDPWILPSPSDTMDATGHAGMSTPLSAAEVAYSLVQQASATPDPIPAPELDPLLEPIWAQDSLVNTDSLDLVLPSDEAIIEAMTGPDKPWEDLHHRSYFLPELHRIEAGEFTITMTGDQPCPINLLATQDIYAEGNMATIAETMPINISRTPENASRSGLQFIYTDLFKEFRDVFAWSYEEMPGIPKIVEHEIITYPDAKPVRLRPVNPRKAAAIKAEVEKLLKAGFIYPIHLTEWVSNPDKKQGTIH
jgi:hypothetical protein